MAEDPNEGLAPLLALATDWLALSERTNIPLELTAHSLRGRGDWRLSIYRTGSEIEGVSIVMPRGDWFLEARGPSAAIYLANAAAIRGQRPATLTTTERALALLRPILSEKGLVGAEHELRTLGCTKAPSAQEGRWAVSADIPALKEYELLLDRDQRNLIDTSWEGLIARKELAVLTRNDAVLASMRRYGPAPSFAGIADLFVVPQARRGRIGTGLAGFVLGEILAQRQAVYVLVDSSDAATLAFYDSLGFEDLGSCYKADLT
jgi:ribosomal protein S18 acetylase RimI-like enzyme